MASPCRHHREYSEPGAAHPCSGALDPGGDVRGHGGASPTRPVASKVTWGLPKHGGAPASPRRDEADVWLVGDCELLRARDGGWVGYVTQVCEAQAATRKILGLDPGEVWIARGNTECAYDPTWQARWDGREWVSVRSPSGRQVDLWAAASSDV